MNTAETAGDKFVTVGTTRFAYRRFGQSHGTPLVLFMGFRGTMDHWDPALLNHLAARRPIMLVENAGVGRSEGEISRSFPVWAQHYIDVIRALGLRQIDVLGYSMGGCVAQLVALEAPGLVRRLILCGTIPSSGEGVVRAPVGPFNRLKAANTPEEHRSAFLHGFFAPSNESQTAGAAAWDRIVNARANAADYVAQDGAHQQAIAFAKFMDPKQASSGTYDRLDQLRMPVLIANGQCFNTARLLSAATQRGIRQLLTRCSGSDDLLLPTNNSVLLWRKLSHANAQLHLFPNSGHGFLYQYADQFAAIVNTFLDNNTPRESHL